MDLDEIQREQERWEWAARNPTPNDPGFRVAAVVCGALWGCTLAVCRRMDLAQVVSQVSKPESKPREPERDGGLEAAWVVEHAHHSVERSMSSLLGPDMKFWRPGDTVFHFLLRVKEGGGDIGAAVRALMQGRSPGRRKSQEYTSSRRASRDSDRDTGSDDD